MPSPGGSPIGQGLTFSQLTRRGLVNLPGKLHLVIFHAPTTCFKNRGDAFWVSGDPNACPSAAVARLQKVRLRRTMSLISLVNLPGKAHFRIFHAPTTCFKNRQSVFWVPRNPNACPSQVPARLGQV